MDDDIMNQNKAAQEEHQRKIDEEGVDHEFHVVVESLEKKQER
jgi:hypothetical protein